MGEGSTVAVSCGIGRRHGSDPKLLWLRWRLAAVALFGPLAWEPPYVVVVALKKKKKNPTVAAHNTPVAWIQSLAG